VGPLLRLFEGATVADTAAVLGVAESTVYAWRCGHRSMIRAMNADRLAVRAGVHPGEIWEEWWG
jgi:transposase-like protein